MKSAAIVLTGLLALLAPAAALAQAPAREPDVSDLQRQLQEMRSQVNRMQSRIEELERAQANSGTNHRAQLAAQDQPGAPQCPTCPPVKPADSPNPPSRPAGALGAGPGSSPSAAHQTRHYPRLQCDWLDRFLQPAHDPYRRHSGHEHSVSREGDAPVARHRGAGRGS